MVDGADDFFGVQHLEQFPVTPGSRKQKKVSEENLGKDFIESQYFSNYVGDEDNPKLKEVLAEPSTSSEDQEMLGGSDYIESQYIRKWVLLGSYAQNSKNSV